MDALSLIQYEHARTQGSWMGALSMRIAISAKDLRRKNAPAEQIAKELNATLAEFIASPVPSEGLRAVLHGYLK